ncbi:MAG: type II toxin-antitoxin system prevent-host-death family antitoxin [Anaerolineaceae bacterium]|nr:type II toxin-antitoxin system prevent-host-death family antitoxin [Anaerolineaceae bacterium]
MKNEWQLQEAKSRFSEVVNNALTQGAQIVTRRGKKEIVILSLADYEKLTRNEQSLSLFLRTSPLAGSGLEITRDSDLPRDIGLA